MSNQKAREFWLRDMDVCWSVFNSEKEANHPRLRICRKGELIHVREVLSQESEKCDTSGERVPGSDTAGDVEEKAKEFGKSLVHPEFHSIVNTTRGTVMGMHRDGGEQGFKAGHASRDDEVAALKEHSKSLEEERNGWCDQVERLDDANKTAQKELTRLNVRIKELEGLEFLKLLGEKNREIVQLREVLLSCKESFEWICRDIKFGNEEIVIRNRCFEALTAIDKALEGKG